jgi:hypothetical protein
MVTGTSSAESDTLAPEQSSFCRGVRPVEWKASRNAPELLAYRSYYRAYLLQKGPRLADLATMRAPGNTLTHKAVLCHLGVAASVLAYRHHSDQAMLGA